jgi:GNAT superfamily N-acetyltransferase
MLVTPALRRRGFGRLILARLDARARALGYRRLGLDAAVVQAAAQRLRRSAS